MTADPKNPPAPDAEPHYWMPDGTGVRDHTIELGTNGRQSMWLKTATGWAFYQSGPASDETVRELSR